MFKLLSSLAIWQVMRANSGLVKKILVYFFILLFSLYFFPDWEDYFTKKNNLDMLLYTKIMKYVFVLTSGFLIFSNLKKLSVLGRELKNKETIKEGELDPDLVELLDGRELETTSEAIRRKNSIED